MSSTSQPVMPSRPLARVLARRLIVVAICVLVLQTGYVIVDYSRQEDYLATSVVETELATLIEAVESGGLDRAHSGILELPAFLESRYEKFPAHYGFELIDRHGEAVAGVNREVLRGIPLESGTLKEEVNRNDTVDGGIRRYGSRLVSLNGATYRWRVANIDDPASVRNEVLIMEVIDHVAMPAVPLVLVMLVTLWLILRKALRPLETAADRVAHVASASTDVRLDLAGAPSEVVALGEAVNQLLDRLQVALAAQREFAANVAHELRTPLSLLILELDSLEGSAVGRAKADAQAMSRLVGQLLAMAQLEGLDPSRLARVDLSALGRDTVGQLAPMALRTGLEIEFVDHTAGIVNCQRETVEAALRNLIENSLRVSPAGGTIRVEAGPGPIIRVIDQGPGVPEDAIDTIFERFRQGDSASRGRAGLGLAIVRRTMELHGGSACAANRPQGGASFALDFNRSATASSRPAGERRQFDWRMTPA